MNGWRKLAEPEWLRLSSAITITTIIALACISASGRERIVITITITIIITIADIDEIGHSFDALSV
jgi:hypothetical protein